MTFDATLNPVVYEGVFLCLLIQKKVHRIWPVALERAFKIYPDVKIVVSAELYGYLGCMDLIKKICEMHVAMLVEYAAEAMEQSSTVDCAVCSETYSAISYNGNKIINDSAGGCLLTNDRKMADKGAQMVHAGTRKHPMVSA